jgi:hypothetical protein
VIRLSGSWLSLGIELLGSVEVEVEDFQGHKMLVKGRNNLYRIDVGCCHLLRVVIVGNHRSGVNAPGSDVFHSAGQAHQWPRESDKTLSPR